MLHFLSLGQPISLLAIHTEKVGSQVSRFVFHFSINLTQLKS